MKGISKVLHKYFFRKDTAIIKTPDYRLYPEKRVYYLSEPMRPVGDGTFELCGGTVKNSLEEIADSVVINLSPRDSGGYVHEKIILYRSFNNEVKGKPYISVSREDVVVNGATSDTDDLLILQKLLKGKISKKL